MKLVMAIVALITAQTALADVPQTIGDLQTVEYKDAFSHSGVISLGTELIAPAKIEAQGLFYKGTNSVSQDPLFAGSDYITLVRAQDRVACSLKKVGSNGSNSIPKRMRFVIDGIQNSTANLGDLNVPTVIISISAAPHYQTVFMAIECTNATARTPLSQIFSAINNAVVLSPDPRRVHSLACVGGHDILGGECVL